MIAMKRAIFLTVILASACMLVNSCEYDGLTGFAVPWKDDVTKVKNPIVSARINDSGEWVEGTISSANVITFELRTAKANWNNLQIQYTYDSAIVDGTAPSTVDLTSACTFTTSDNYIPVTYTVEGLEYSPVKTIEVTVDGETCSGTPDSENNVNLYFNGSSLDAANVKINLKDGTLVSPSSLESVQNLTSPLVIKVKDNVRTYEYTLTAQALVVPDGWSDITSTIAGEGGILPAYMRVYEKTNIGGTEGNKARVVIIPSGHVNLKTAVSQSPVAGSSYKYAAGQAAGDVVSANKDYSFFLGGTGVGFYRPEILVGYINDGKLGEEASVYRDTYYYTCPPALGVKDGKAEIHYSEYIDGQLYKYDTPQNGADKSKFTKGEVWNVDAAVSGYSLPLLKGTAQVTKNFSESYGQANTEQNKLWKKERFYSFGATTDGLYLSQRKFPVDYWSTTVAYNEMKAQWWDGSHIARTFVGVRANGDLIAFISERYSDLQGFLVDATGYPSAGTTFVDAVRELVNFNCTDAMALAVNECAVGIVKDGNTGLDLTKTYSRTKTTDLKHSTILMFK